MPEPLLYFKSMGAAAIVSALCVLAMALRQEPASATRLNAACVLAICLGVGAGHCVLSLGLAWPPVNGLDRLMTVVIPAALGIELIAGFRCVPAAVAWFLRMSLAAAIPGILWHGSIYVNGADQDWSAGAVGTAWVACSALLAGLWGLLSRLSQHSQSGVSISLALVMAIQCAGLTVMMAGYVKGGAATFPLAATIAGTTLGARLAAGRLAPALLGLGVVELFGAILIGRFFGRLSTACALVVLLAPLLCWVTEIPQLRHRNRWIVGSLRLVLVAIALLVVLAVSKRDFDRDMAPLLGNTRVAIDAPSPAAISVD